ncbi:hypothetical protein ACS0TY_004776 [Phlomoides rotata]
MAYASLVSLQQTTKFILVDLHKYSISVDEREKIKAIREHVNFLIPFLENFPEKAYPLEGKIRDLANEAEDVIELFMWNQFHLGVELSRGEFEGQLDRVRWGIGSIAWYIVNDRLGDILAVVLSSRLAATAKNAVVIGLDGDLIAIKGRLRGESSKLQIIPIVGMGGIGKTTLARYAYDDPFVMEYFDIRVFIQVSQDYSAKDFLSNLLASIKTFEEGMSGEKNESRIVENESDIALKVYQRLKGQRYLIVMDDIWSTGAWDDVRNIFPDDNNGSRIMLTTRLTYVASYACCGSPLHEMKFMDGHQSWSLLKQKVFTNGQDCPPELEDIGKEIARACGGLPLAVVLLGGILSMVVKTRASWEEIMKNVNSDIDGQLDRILSLSYTHLPHYLRPCFLFSGGFPEDHIIHVSRLIRLWVAEGFLKHQNGCKSLEEEVEEYLGDLVKRSLVLITSRKSDGKIKSCSLHDLVRDMCIRKAQEEKFFLMDGRVLSENVQHRRQISISNSRLYEISGPTIHTVLCFQTTMDSFSLDSLENLRLLRVLDIMRLELSFLPPQVFELFHLRYLALGGPTSIPSIISKLQNLQTLIIRPRRRAGFISESLATYLPPEIWRMPHLRVLVLIESYMLLDPVCPTHPLENLHTLSGVPSFVCSERILKMIPNLKKLGIFYYRNEKIQNLLHNLVNLHQLEKLKITASWRCYPWQGQYPAFPLALKKLSLVGGGLPWKDMSFVGSLPNLQVLKLKSYACEGDTWETSEGEFPELKFLLIDESNLQYWITESNHFPRLECLALQRCQRLREIPDSIGEIPTLKLIEVDSQNESLLKSGKRIQEDQLSYGNDDLQVHCKRR